MWRQKKEVFISNFAGLGNRLESLVLATLFEERFGHQIVLDWPEGETLRVKGTTAGRLMPWQRLGATKVRDFGLQDLESLGRLSKIILRATYGPVEIQHHYLAATAGRLFPGSKVLNTIIESLTSVRSRLLVGVHVRHGDFRLPDEDNYDATANRHPAVPLWWYEHVMSMYVKRVPEVCFLLCYAGDVEKLRTLRDKFDIMMLPKTVAYRPMQAGHTSAGHPVIDLFSLACCSTLIASPTSSFSHWAANMLGPETTCILPPPKVTRDRPAQNALRLRGRILREWRAAAELGSFSVPIVGAAELPQPEPAQFDWLQKNCPNA